MHGIWWVMSIVNFANYYNIYRPTQLGKEGPNYCNKSATFSLEAIDVSKQLCFSYNDTLPHFVYYILYITEFDW